MVLDRLDWASVYFPLSPGLRRALEHLQATDWSATGTGRHDIDGDALFAIVSDYQTRSSADVAWEAHRRYIDVQFVHSGVERIGHAPLAALTVTGYDEARDLVTARGDGGYVTVAAGMFAILWPQDAHRPGVTGRRRSVVRKVVLKVDAR